MDYKPFYTKDGIAIREKYLVTRTILGIEQATAKPLVSFCYHSFLCSALFKALCSLLFNLTDICKYYVIYDNKYEVQYKCIYINATF